jgi:uncharacterized protein (DUF362 family)
MVNVALVKGTNRYETVTKALNLIRGDIKLPDRPVLIKPNLVSTTKDKELAITHRDSAIAAMDFLKGMGVRKFILGDGAGLGARLDGALDNFGYRELAKRYDIEFRDLNFDTPVEITLFDREFKPRTYQISKTVVDCYRVSIPRMKTHDTVIVTLAVKNTVIGCLVGAANKPTVHQGYPAMNLSMARVAATVPNDISIIDGIVGMEGDGPVGGTAVNHGVVVASANQVACDYVGSELMGFDPDDVGYLYYLREMQGLPRQQIRVLGERVEACRMKYKPHSTYKAQLGWRIPDWRRHLGVPAVVP